MVEGYSTRVGQVSIKYERAKYRVSKKYLARVHLLRWSMHATWPIN